MNRHFTALFAAFFLTVAGVAYAESPNLEPGEWQFEHVTSVEGQEMIPPQTDNVRQCVTREDVASAENFLESGENCEVQRLSVTRDQLSYDMVCIEAGMRVEMQAELNFAGTRMHGEMRANLDSPMGEMLLLTRLSGERIGDC